MPVTMTEIANKLGVSQSTVSLVLNGKANDRVSPEKRTLIEETAQHMGFRPNLAAKRLRTSKTYTIGILLPSPKGIFYGGLVAQLQHALANTNYSALFAFWENAEGISRATQSILSHGADAIITVDPKVIPEGLNIPVVSYFDYDERFDFVGLEHRAAVNDSLDYLMKLGHRRIGYIGAWNDLRYQIFAEELKHRGLPADKTLFFNEALGEQEQLDYGFKGLEALFRHSDPPTAVLTHNDEVAVGVLQKAWKTGIRVPADLSVIGFDNIPQSAYTIPPLTTFQYLTGKPIAELLLKFIFKRLENPFISQQIHIVKPEMVIRESCSSHD